MDRRKRFGNQTPEQIIKHLCHYLGYNARYNLTIDPLEVHFVITESMGSKKGLSDKRRRIREEQRGKSKKYRKMLGTKKRTRPKIRSVKKGRTVELKGRQY